MIGSKKTKWLAFLCFWRPRCEQTRNGEWNTPVASFTAYHLGIQRGALYFWLQTENQLLQHWIRLPLVHETNDRLCDTDSRSQFQNGNLLIHTVLIPDVCYTRLLAAFTASMRMRGWQYLLWWKGCKTLIDRWWQTFTSQELGQRHGRGGRAVTRWLLWTFAKQFIGVLRLRIGCLRTSSICADEVGAFPSTCYQ